MLKRLPKLSITCTLRYNFSHYQNYCLLRKSFSLIFYLLLKSYTSEEFLKIRFLFFYFFLLYTHSDSSCVFISHELLLFLLIYLFIFLGGGGVCSCCIYASKLVKNISDFTTSFPICDFFSFWLGKEKASWLDFQVRFELNFCVKLHLRRFCTWNVFRVWFVWEFGKFCEIF